MSDLYCDIRWLGGSRGRKCDLSALPMSEIRFDPAAHLALKHNRLKSERGILSHVG